jgi:lysophospholipase L1-like esterase
LLYAFCILIIPAVLLSGMEALSMLYLTLNDQKARPFLMQKTKGKGIDLGTTVSNANGNALVADQLDPLLGWAYDTSRLEGDANRPGFVVYGADQSPDQPILVVLGGSTTDHQYNPGHNWPRLLSELLQEQGEDVAIYNGGVFGYNSSQELLKLIRDVLPMHPLAVVVYDGINDFVTSQTPLVHSSIEDLYTSILNKDHWLLPNTMQVVRELSGPIKRMGLSIGTRQEASPWELWARNARLMHAACKAEGIAYLHVLQPCLGVGEYFKTKYEADYLIPSMVKMRGDYWELLGNFYEPARNACASMEFCVDFVDVFADVATEYTDNSTGMYLDARHPNSQGNGVIAKALAAELRRRDMLPSGKKMAADTDVSSNRKP